MSQTLACWLGATDLKAQNEDPEIGLGPIAQAAAEEDFEHIYILSNYQDKETSSYIDWLQPKTRANLHTFNINLSSPTNFSEIYQAARSCLQSIEAEIDQFDLTIHLSPGTPAMAAVWIILAKTRFPARLIESSKEHGVKTASVPFDISADFLPDLLKPKDKSLEQISLEPPPDAPEFSAIIHRSEIMKRVLRRAQKVAPRSVPVLIEGESGTGKELLARAIHQASPRKDRPFVPVNCGAIPSELIESELFGYEKGAFTGAEKRRKGYFEEAQEGTIFLDEIGELPLKAQVKLLRTLQEKEIVPLGANQAVKLDVRIIAATNRILTEEISAGSFRADLFYRLAVAVIKIPALRDRTGDLSLLIDKLMEQVNKESQTEPDYKYKKISAGAKNLLLKHPWPGNVRELLNTLRRAAIWTDGELILEEDIKDNLFPVRPKIDSDSILNRSLENGIHLPEIMSEVARHYLKRALKKTGGNKTKTAEILGLSNYQTLSNWLKKYGV